MLSYKVDTSCRPRSSTADLVTILERPRAQLQPPRSPCRLLLPRHRRHRDARHPRRHVVVRVEEDFPSRDRHHRREVGDRHHCRHESDHGHARGSEQGLLERRHFAQPPPGLRLRHSARPRIVNGHRSRRCAAFTFYTRNLFLQEHLRWKHNHRIPNTSPSFWLENEAPQPFETNDT